MTAVPRSARALAPATARGRIITGSAPSLALAAAAQAGLLLTAFNVLDWIRGWPQSRVHNDFRLDYAGALVGLNRGWERIYDLGLQNTMMERQGFFFQPYISPPPLTWLAAPLTWLPFEPALALWTLGLFAALVFSALMTAPGSRTERAVHLLLCTGLFPVAFAIMIGQPAPLLAAVLTLVWWLLKRKCDWQAGLVLSLVVVKPQLAFLVPLALLAAGRVVTFLTWLGASALWALLFVVGAGSVGVRDYLGDLALASHWTLTQQFTIGELVGHGPSLALIQATLVGLAVLGAWRQRQAGPELPLAIGISASLLVTPYIGFQDFLVLVIAAWLALRAAPSPLLLAVVVAGYVALELGLVVGTVPVVLCELAFLGSISFARRANAYAALSPKSRVRPAPT